MAHEQLRTLRQTPPLQTRRTAQTGAQLRTLRQTPRLQTRRTAHATGVTGEIGRAAAPPIAPVFVGAAAAVGAPITPAPVATSSAIAITANLLPLDIPFMLALLCDEPGPLTGVAVIAV
jgi:hypothetical protein